MPDRKLKGFRILVVEDEYLLADDLSSELEDAGAEVLGPIGNVEDASAFIDGDAQVDAAILDVNLRGDLVFPVADALRARGVPFLFATGYDQGALPDRFADAPRVEKPFKGARAAAMLGDLVAG